MPDDFETVKLESRTDCVKCASRKPAAKSVKCRRVLVSIADQSGSVSFCRIFYYYYFLKMFLFFSD